MAISVRKGGRKPSASTDKAKSIQTLQKETRSLRRELNNARKTATALDKEVQTYRAILQQSGDYQVAISNILSVISSSHSDLQPVFETIVEAAHRLCRSEQAFIFRLNGDKYGLAAAKDANSAQIKLLQQNPIVQDRSSITGRVAIECRAIQVEDVLADPEYKLNVSGVRTTLGVPLLRDGVAIGIIVLTKSVVQAFTQEQIDLVSTFATQALIAIENVRLFDEVQASALQLNSTVEELRALGDVTHAINSSVDLESVLNTIVAKATQISGTDAGAIYMFDRSTQEFWLRTTHGVDEEILSAIKDVRVNLKDNKMGDVLERRAPIQFSDVEGQTSSPELDVIIQAGFRSLLVVPLLDSDGPVGTLVLRRKRPGNFVDQTIEVMQTFAAQSVLAIRHARLFAEIQERTNDLGESLQQQTATADVLKVISRSTFNLQLVLDTLVESAAKLCEAEKAFIFQRDGDFFRLAANFGHSSEFEEYARKNPIAPGRGTTTGRTVVEGRTIHIPDVLADPEYTNTNYQSRGGFRTNLGVPLRREGETIGVFTLTRQVVRPFTPRQIELVETFADQAVIAIENVKLFDEVQARTRDLSEALTYQIGTSSILSVIASSPTDVAPVLQAIVKSACELCGAYDALVRLKFGDELRPSAHHGPIPASRKNWRINRNWADARSLIENRCMCTTCSRLKAMNFPRDRKSRASKVIAPL